MPPVAVRLSFTQGPETETSATATPTWLGYEPTVDLDTGLKTLVRAE